MPEVLPVPFLDPATDLAHAIALGAAGIAAAILVVGALILVVLTDAAYRLRRIGDELHRLNQEGVDIHVEAGALGRSPFDAEQLVRGAGYLITLLRKVVKRDGEAIPSADRQTLDLAEVMGVPLPTRDEAVSITPRGATIKSGLLPYGSKSIPAHLDREAV